jgi:hypothetical protein
MKQLISTFIFFQIFYPPFQKPYFYIVIKLFVCIFIMYKVITKF